MFLSFCILILFRISNFGIRIFRVEYTQIFLFWQVEIFLLALSKKVSIMRLGFSVMRVRPSERDTTSILGQNGNYGRSNSDRSSLSKGLFSA